MPAHVVSRRVAWLVLCYVVVTLWVAGALPPSRAEAASSGVAGRTIVIDPGHGGIDPGVIANGFEEKYLTLPIGLAVGAILTQRGARVVYTRTSDVTIGPPDSRLAGLAARTTLANSVGADAYVSVHANSIDDPSFSGVMTFYGVARGYVNGVTRTPTELAKSRLLAQDIQNRVRLATGAVDRGVRDADFYVLGSARMPSVLVETGFVTNRAEAQRLNTAAYQRVVAEGIAGGLAQFFQSVGSTANVLSPATDARFMADATYPDHTRVAPGASIVKTWRIANTGTAPWTPRMRLVAQPGGNVQASASIPLPPTAPGATADVSVTIQAPVTAGTVSAVWRLTDAYGQAFGDPLWLLVDVPDATTFAPSWVRTTEATTLWSDFDSHADELAPLPRGASLEVLAPRISSRLKVRDPASGQTGYVDASAVSATAPPPGATRGSVEAKAVGSSDPPKPASESGQTYTVALGDTLSAIARRFQVSESKLIDANNLTDANLLVAGQALTIPAGVAPFQPFWVENFAPATLWSGTDAAAQSFGNIPQFTPMHVLGPPSGNRYEVRVSTTGGTAYIDGALVGPSGPPKGAS